MCLFVVTESKFNNYTPVSQKTPPILGPALYLEIFSPKTALTLEVVGVNGLTGHRSAIKVV